MNDDNNSTDTREVQSSIGPNDENRGDVSQGKPLPAATDTDTTTTDEQE